MVILSRFSKDYALDADTVDDNSILSTLDPYRVEVRVDATNYIFTLNYPVL